GGRRRRRGDRDPAPAPAVGAPRRGPGDRRRRGRGPPARSMSRRDRPALPGRTPVAGGTAELLGDADREGSWVLLVDGTPQSHVDLDDPAHLEFEYVRRIGHVLDLAAP